MVPVLSGKKARFVELYLGEAQGDPAKAAALAGFDVPDRQGQLLLRSADVRAAIEASVNAAKPLEPVVTAMPIEASSSAAAAAPPGAPLRSAEQCEACDILVLRTVHEVTEHYRAHRPKLFEGFDRFVPGATHEALKRFSPLRPSPTATAFKRICAKRLVQVASRTRTPEGADPALFPPGRLIFQPSEAGLQVLRSLDEAQFARAMELVPELLKAPERRRQLRAPE